MLDANFWNEWTVLRTKKCGSLKGLDNVVPAADLVAMTARIPEQVLLEWLNLENGTDRHKKEEPQEGRIGPSKSSGVYSQCPPNKS